jgi:hypothetical protein
MVPTAYRRYKLLYMSPANNTKEITIAVIPDHNIFFVLITFTIDKIASGRNPKETIFSRCPALILETK